MFRVKSRFRRIKRMLCCCHLMTIVKSRIRLEFPYNALGTFSVIISKRVRWVGHAAHIGQERPAYKVLVGKAEYWKQLRRPRHKCVKCTLVQALRLCTGRTAHRRNRGIALSFHDHGTRRG